MSSLVKDTPTSNISTLRATGLGTKKKPGQSSAPKAAKSLSKKSASKRPSQSGQSSPAKIALAAITFAVLTISLNDLAAGFGLLTGMPEWQCWLLAVGVDALYCAVEYVMLTAGHDDREVTTAAVFMIFTTALLSSALNGLAFAAHSTMPWVAAGVGAMIPFLILGATFILSRVK
jgi:hypothetical protein